MLCGINIKMQTPPFTLKILSITGFSSINELMASTHFYILKPLWFYLTEHITLQLTPCF